MPSLTAQKQPPQQTTCFTRFYAASGPAICAQTLDFLDFLDFRREMHIFMAKPFCGIRACPLCSDFIFFRFFRFPMGKAHFHGQAFQPPHNRHSEPRILLKFLILVPFLGETQKIKNIKFDHKCRCRVPHSLRATDFLEVQIASM